jgi:transcriptional regulator with GAF, ATPase, and Fis domain
VTPNVSCAFEATGVEGLVERRLILKTLEHCAGNRTRTARVLGISLRSLRNKLRDYAAEGIRVPAPRPSQIPAQFPAHECSSV